MQTFTKKSIKQELFSKLEPDKEFTLKDAYEAVTSTDKKHSIRARIYECVDKGLFLKVSKGVYKMVDTEENSVLLVQGNGRDLSRIQDNTIDCIITDHPYSDTKSNKGGNRSFAEYNTFNYTKEDFDEKFRVLKNGSFLVEFFAEENSNNFDYIYTCKKWAQEAGFQYYSTVNWKKGNFVSNTGRKAKNSEQMVFFTKGNPRSLKLDAKKNLAEAVNYNIETKGLTSHDIVQKLQEQNAPIHYMKGTNGMLPTVFDVEKTPKKMQIHQAEKPVELFEQLLHYITLPNEVVLDQFTGSANIGKACLNTNRNAILIEYDTETYQKAAQALEEFVA